MCSFAHLRCQEKKYMAAVAVANPSFQGGVGFDVAQHEEIAWRKTLPSPTGRLYVLSSYEYPQYQLPEPLSSLVLAAHPGEMIEVLSRRGEWAIGKRVLRGHASLLPGARSEEGAFRFDWVRGLAVHSQPSMCPVCIEVDPRTFEPKAPAGDRLGRFHENRRQRMLERVSQLWTLHGSHASPAERARAEANLATTAQSAARELAIALRQKVEDQQQQLRKRQELEEDAAPAASAAAATAAAAPAVAVASPEAKHPPLALQVMAELEVQQQQAPPSPPTAPGLGLSRGLFPPSSLQLRPAFPTSIVAEEQEPRGATSSTSPELLSNSSPSPRKVSAEEVLLKGFRRPKYPGEPRPRSQQAPPKKIASNLSDPESWARAVARNVAARRSAVPEQEMSPPSRRFARGLLNAKRSGELQAILEEWEKAQSAMVTSASDLQALKERFKSTMLGAHRRGELQRLAEDLASEVEDKAADFQRLKERALRSLLEMKRAGQLERLAQQMGEQPASSAEPAKSRVLRSLLALKRSGELERLAQEMGQTQQELNVKAVELREWSAGQKQGSSDDLHRIAGEIERVLDSTTEQIRSKLARSLLRAHRTGELQELKGELDEMVDTVPQTMAARAAYSGDRSRRRWAEMTTSESEMEQGAEGKRDSSVEAPTSDAASESERASPSPRGGAHRGGLRGVQPPMSSALKSKRGSPGGRLGRERPGSPDTEDPLASSEGDAQHDDIIVWTSQGSASPERRKKKNAAARTRFARTLLNAKRSGKLQELADEWQSARSAMMSSASELQDLKNRVQTVISSQADDVDDDKCVADLASEVRKKADGFQQLKERARRSILQMKRAGELERLAQEMGCEEEDDDQRSGSHVSAKERALRSLLEMKRSGELEQLAHEMEDTQAKLEAKAAQLQEICARTRRGLRDAKRSGELERLAQEMNQVLEVKMQTIRERVKRSLLRAHRTGELQELRGELDELADEVPLLTAAQHTKSAPAAATRGRRWCDMTTSSDSDGAAGPDTRTGVFPIGPGNLSE